MNQLSYFFAEYILIPTADAAVSPAFANLIKRINDQVINPFIVLLFTAALVMFVVGMFKFFSSGQNGATEDRETGKRHLLWGIIGMAIMVSVFGIMNFITSSLGLQNVSPDSTTDYSGLIE